MTAKRLAGAMPETYNHYYAALRFMYKRVFKINWSEDKLPRMKRDRSLPTILDREEIDAILDVTTNLKYKAIFAVMYSGGLRVSETTHLHYKDISRKNHSIHIHNTKNRLYLYTKNRQCRFSLHYRFNKCVSTYVYPIFLPMHRLYFRHNKYTILCQ